MRDCDIVHSLTSWKTFALGHNADIATVTIRFFLLDVGCLIKIDVFLDFGKKIYYVYHLHNLSKSLPHECFLHV